MKTEKEIGKLAEEWMKGKERYVTYDAHITGFVKGFRECQELQSQSEKEITHSYLKGKLEILNKYSEIIGIDAERDIEEITEYFKTL